MQVFGWYAGGSLQGAEHETPSLNYHGWRIDILQQQSVFTFQCYPPDLSDFLDAGEEYTDRGTALQAAYDFVDQEIAIRAFLEVANEWLWKGVISEAEYWNLTNFE